MVDIQNHTTLFKIIDQLKPDAQPLWGQMSPQHIVEHLAFAVSISTGKGPQHLYLTPEEANAFKQKIVHSDMALPQGIKNPILGDTPPALRLPDMPAAIQALRSELEYFETYYANHPNATHTHPRMGDLNRQEWITLHNKHFTHHFNQYNLLTSEN